MGSYRLSRGVYVKSRRDWNATTLAGGSYSKAAVGGSYIYAILFNDSEPSVDLGLYGFTAYQSVSGHPSILAYTYGLPAGAALVSRANPLTAGSARPQGAFYSLTTANVLGTRLGDFSGPDGWFFALWEYPMAIIPPGYSLLLSPAGTNSSLNASMIWGVA